MSATAAQIAARVGAGEISAAEVVRAALARLDAVEPRVHAFITVFRDEAVRAAGRVDERVRRGDVLPLAGVPVAIKDNLCVGPDLSEPGDGLGYGGRTTAASKMLADYRSPFTATCVQRLIEAGAVLVGKTNLDEFAMGSSTEHSAFGPTRNPWDLERVPGGSSGGSAAAVAAGVCPLALGSDTGGSIRQPAGHSGVVGIKPTYGRVSRLGLIAFASSLDQVGPFATTVLDAANGLRVICGEDPGDSTSARREVPDFGAMIATAVKDLRVGVPRQAREGANDPEVAGAFERAISAYREIGATIVDVDLPLTDSGIAAYYIVAPAEASSNLARFDGIRYGHRAGASGDLADLYARSRSEGFGPEVKRRIMLGTHVLSSGYYDAYYTTALKVRRRVLAEYSAAFESCHVIATPSSPGPAFRIGEKTADPLAMYLEDVYTVGVNLAGLPGMTLPMGLTQRTPRPLPLGLQLVAPAFEESLMLRAARMYEARAGLSLVPPL